MFLITPGNRVNKWTYIKYLKQKPDYNVLPIDKLRNDFIAFSRWTVCFCDLFRKWEITCLVLPSAHCCAMYCTAPHVSPIWQSSSEILFSIDISIADMWMGVFISMWFITHWCVYFFWMHDDNDELIMMMIC